MRRPVGRPTRISERGLFPALRTVRPEGWVVADSFSRLQQIEQGTARGMVHVAELAAACLRRGE